ncbi:MAG TPA: hypothetical protein EYN66_24070 [Myxococcales bacterium]|nr:hypothetical protein [Myxococcales bacterium]
MAFYEFDTELACQERAIVYNTRQQAVSRAAGDTVTTEWDKPRQGVNGKWYLQKPAHLHCKDLDLLGCVVVDDPELPDEDTP